MSNVITIETLIHELSELNAKRDALEERIEALKAETTVIDDERRELSNLGLSEDEVEIILDHRHPVADSSAVPVGPVDERQVQFGWYPATADLPAGFAGKLGRTGATVDIGHRALAVGKHVSVSMTPPTVYDDGKSDVTRVRDALAGGLWLNSFALQTASGLDHHRATKAVRKLIKADAVEHRGVKRLCEYHLVIAT